MAVAAGCELSELPYVPDTEEEDVIDERTELVDLQLSRPAALSPRFDARTSEYAAAVPLLVQTVTVTAVAASPHARITVDGVELASGEESAPIELGLGTSEVLVEVFAPTGASQRYSVAIDRAHEVAQSAYAKASNTGPNDLFGYSVALSGNVMAVGAIFESSATRGVDGDQTDENAPESGAVYVFRHDGAAWRQEAYIKASNTGAGDGFGTSVAIDGDWLAVGAPLEDSDATGIGGAESDAPAGMDSGAVYVFRRSASGWRQHSYVKASNTGAGDWFGTSVAISGDTLAVGAPYEDSDGTGVDADQASDRSQASGAVYVFERQADGWSQQSFIKASNTGREDLFGMSVSLSGNTLAVGAPWEDGSSTGVNGDERDDGMESSGAVYVFARSGRTWRQRAYVKASNPGIGDWFGWSVSLSGNRLAVGAVNEASGARGVNADQLDNSADGCGAVYVFEQRDGSWAQDAYIKTATSAAGHQVGWSVSIAGDVLAVSAALEGGPAGQRSAPSSSQATGSVRGSGAVHVFVRDHETWREEAHLRASNADGNDWFGWSVAVSEGGLAVGAINEASGATGTGGSELDESAPLSGAVYLFR